MEGRVAFSSSRHTGVPLSWLAVITAAVAFPYMVAGSLRALRGGH